MWFMIELQCPLIECPLAIRTPDVIHGCNIKNAECLCRVGRIPTCCPYTVIVDPVRRALCDSRATTNEITRERS